MENIFLIDMDTEVTDLLFTTTTATSSFAAPPETLDKGIADDTDNVRNLDENNKMQIEQISVQLPDSVKPKKGAPKKYNLRKSLAWDAAFFTSEGVLDPEELAAINSKLGKIELPALPGIQLDMQKSFESNATLESSKTCTVQKPAENTGKECKNDTALSQKIIKSTMTFNKNKNNVRQVMDNNRNGGLKSSLKPPRVASGIEPSNKKNSVHERIQGKNNKSYKTLADNSDDKKSIVLSKKIGTRESYQSTIQKTSSGKISHVPNPSKKIPSTGSCSTSTSRSTSTGSKGFHAPDIKNYKKKVDSVNVEKSTKDVPASKILPKVFKSKKEQCEISIGKSKRFSSSSHLLNESPNRSFDSIGSESSFSSISIGNSSVSSTETNVNKSSLLIRLSTNNQAGDSRQSLKKPCLRTTKSKILNNTPVSGDSSNQQGKISLTISFKPSGLRLPSPKFGYFSMENSATCNSTTSKQVLPSAFCQNTTGINKPNILIKPVSSKIKFPTVDKKVNSSLMTTTLPSIEEGSQMTSKRLSELTSNLQGEAKPEASHESLLISEKKNSNQNELHLSQHAKLLEGDEILTSDLLHSQIVSDSDKENLLPSSVK